MPILRFGFVRDADVVDTRSLDSEKKPRVSREKIFGKTSKSARLGGGWVWRKVKTRRFQPACTPAARTANQTCRTYRLFMACTVTVYNTYLLVAFSPGTRSPPPPPSVSGFLGGETKTTGQHNNIVTCAYYIIIHTHINIYIHTATR